MTRSSLTCLRYNMITHTGKDRIPGLSLIPIARFVLPPTRDLWGASRCNVKSSMVLKRSSSLYTTRKMRENTNITVLVGGSDLRGRACRLRLIYSKSLSTGCGYPKMAELFRDETRVTVSTREHHHAVKRERTPPGSSKRSVDDLSHAIQEYQARS
jgi:hypothetical protein